MRNRFSIVITAVLLVTLGFNAIAQLDPLELEKVIKSDSAVVYAIAAYPEDVRNNVFISGQRADGLVRISNEKTKSNKYFRIAISNYSKQDQQKIWNLTLYDGLIHQMNSDDAEAKLPLLLKEYPADIQESVSNFVKNDKQLIHNIDSINNYFNHEFENIIYEYPAPLKTAFRSLLKTPELYDLLSTNIPVLVRLADMNKANSDIVSSRFRELNLELAQQKALDVEAWKKEISEDKDASKELQESAKSFAKENGYSENDYYDTDPKVIEKVIIRPYPYWCGYPYWYGPDWWYDYPVWFHWGFNFWNGQIAWINVPSWNFIHWHFNHHPHFYSYPHITNLYINHYYYGPRRGIVTNSIEVHRWMKENGRSFPADFNINKPMRIARIKEYGKSENDRIKYNDGHHDQPMNREEYMKKHKEAYPLLRNVRPDNQSSAPVRDIRNNNQKPEVRPVIKPGIRQNQHAPVIKPRRNENHQQIRKTSRTPGK